MPYCNITTLLEVLTEGRPDGFAELMAERNRTRHGLLSVGVKLHLLKCELGFEMLLKRLGPEAAHDRNVYRRSNAHLCLVLPPMGSAQGMIRLLRCIENYATTEIFNNPDIQIQVCSPGRLDRRRAAYLAIAFYLGSDTLRRYTLDEFMTTVSDSHYCRGRRLVIYDAADAGVFDRDFAWWRRSRQGARIVAAVLPFAHAARTDIIVGTGSTHDIEIINLVATLLAHSHFAEHGGYWRTLGMEFEDAFAELLRQHCLPGIVEAPWVHIGEYLDKSGDERFFAALQELMNYALDEAERSARHVRQPLASLMLPPKSGILEETRNLLETFRKKLIVQSEAATHGDPR